MKKVTFLAMILLVLGSEAFSQARNGGIAREAAMGASQAGSGLVLNPFIMDDPALMLLNPAYVAAYKNYGWSNIGGGALTGLATSTDNGYNLQNAGIALGVTDEFTLGAILSYDPSAIGGVSTLMSGLSPVKRPNSAGGPQAIPPVQNMWEVVGALHLATIDLGLGVMYGSSNADSKVTTTTPSDNETQASAHVFGFRGGANFDLGGSSSLDLSAALRLDKATDNIDNTPTVAGEGGDYSASGTELIFAARGKFKVTSKFNFVPYGVFATASAEPKEDLPPNNVAASQNSLKLSALAYALGIGGEYRTPTVYVAGGLSWQTAQLKQEIATPPAPGQTITDRFTALPVFNLGAEWWFTDWLAGRMGYFRYNGNVNSKSETATTTDETNSTVGHTIPGFFTLPGVNSNIIVGGLNSGTWDGVVTLGIGMRFGGFALDATVSDQALRRGFGLIGASDNINTFGYMTGSYSFND